MHWNIKESDLCVMANLPSKESIELIPYRYDQEIIVEVIEQLQKDILLSGGALEIPEQAYHDIILLKQVITDFVNQVSVTNAQLLFNLFYRVDIPQKIVVDVPEEMAELLLKRELLKVLTRRFYGKQKS